MSAKFQVNQWQHSIQKKMMGVISPPSLRQRLRGQSTSVGIWLITPIEPSDPLNYKPLFKHCNLQIILHVLLLFIFVWNKIFCSKKWALFYIWFGVAFAVTVIKSQCFWCSLCKILRNLGFFSYSRYHLLEIPIKSIL